jgi:hypothetical protein
METLTQVGYLTPPGEAPSGTTVDRVSAAHDPYCRPARCWSLERTSGFRHPLRRGSRQPAGDFTTPRSLERFDIPEGTLDHSVA